MEKARDLRAFSLALLEAGKQSQWEEIAAGQAKLDAELRLLLSDLSDADKTAELSAVLVDIQSQLTALGALAKTYQAGLAKDGKQLSHGREAVSAYNQNTKIR